MFRTPDGRIWPFQPGSSLQDTFVDIVFAPPGKGKSVYLNTANLATCLSVAATQGIGGVKLPRIAIIDVGPSSSGLVSLLKEALPPERRHEAEYHRLRMTKDFAINPFDTQLGCRVAFPHERAFLVNFLTALGTPPGEQKPPSGLSDVAGFCIEALYKRFNDKETKSQPRRYQPSVDYQVDKAIKDYNIETNKTTIWWEIVDELYERGDIHHATLAQRYAVPKIEDLGTVLNEPKIKDVFQSALADNGEPTLAVFERMYISALAEYPILQSETRFDIGDSRVVSLDLDEVAPRGGKPAEKQTALMYMLARFVLARDFYLNQDLVNARHAGLPMIPDLYKDYHMQRITRIRETPKRLVYDEFHRTSSSQAVREQVLIDIREGRKWNVHIALASQLIDDFDQAMVDMATGIWVMGVGNEREAKKAADVFNISATGCDIMTRRLTGPTSRGSPFLAVLYLKEGRHEHLLYNTLGPNELWAFSTTAEDAGLRNRLYTLLTANEARRRLAIRFPGGSAKGEIERRQAISAELGAKITDDFSDGIIDELCKEILAMKE
jgi:intracellular multiplication protein IcmB